MELFKYEIRDSIAWVVFDSGSMNTLSRAAISELGILRGEIEDRHATQPLSGVILRGNRFGLGAGANIGELMSGSRQDLEELIDEGHKQMLAIEEGELLWLAALDGYALGGIYELALACDGIIATATSTVGFPEMKLNIFPGLGGTQRMPRRSGLVSSQDPDGGDAGFSAILQARNFKAPKAAAIAMIDAVVPATDDFDQFAQDFLTNTLATIDRTPPADLARAESLRSTGLAMVKRATMGRNNPRAPYEALDVMIKGAALPLGEALKLERDSFIEVATSAEGKAGMRFFFTQQSVQKLPRGFGGKAGKLEKIGIDGIDGYMGNAIAWLALEAGYQVVGHVPVADYADSVTPKLKAKYQRHIKKGKLSEDEAAAKVASVEVSTDIDVLFDCDLVIAARTENRQIKAEFYRRLGGGLKPGALVSSNSSSMGPGILGEEFRAGGGDPATFVNLHFFSPAEHPAMQLVEVIRAEASSDDAVARAHAFVRRIGKTPVLLNDGSPGFLVNACLADYFSAAEDLYLEGTPVETIDRAIRSVVLPMGPFELADQAGLDTTAGMYDTMAAASPLAREPLAWKMREAGRLGVKTAAGYYDYEAGRKTGQWKGLDSLVHGRGTRTATDGEIVEHCIRALYKRARLLTDQAIVASAEEADLAFVLGIGFAMHLGGAIFYGQQQGWEAP